MTRRTIEQYDFKKGLFDEKLLADIKGYPRRQTTPRRQKVTSVTIHHMIVRSTNNGGACQACIDIWKNREASAHYGVDKKVVTQFVYDNSEAWGNANTTGNQTSIIVEHANKTLAPSYEIDEETLVTSAKLVAGLHIIHDLGRPTSKGFGVGGTIRTHQSWYATACPGPYFKKHWDRYVKMVQDAYDVMVKAPTPKPTTPVTPKPTPEVPVVEPTRPTLEILHWNIAGSDDVNGYGAANHYRGDEVGRHAKNLGFDVFLACEAGQSVLRKAVDKILGKSWTSNAKAIWINDQVKLIKPRKIYGASTKYRYLKSQKYGAAIFGEFKGRKFAVLEIHTDYRAQANQAGQVRSIFEQFLKDTDKYGIHRHNVVVVGDFNWDGTSGDNPFKALSSLNFVEWGDKKAGTFLNTNRHLDGALAHVNARVEVAVRTRNDGNMNLSDHKAVKVKLKLK